VYRFDEGRTVDLAVPVGDLEGVRRPRTFDRILMIRAAAGRPILD
jgi:hypothetical protein